MRRFPSIITSFACASLFMTLATPVLAETAPPVVAATPGVTTATTSYADLAEKLLPAVVNIATTQKVTAAMQGEDDGDDLQQQMPQFPPGSPFEQFFKDFLERHGQNSPGGQGTPQPRKMASLGSGFIVDADKGYVITNNHVVEDAEEINVTLQDNTTIKAKLIGTDTKTDVAVLKVDPAAFKNHHFADVKFGDSDIMRVGDPVLAIGNPFGLGGTVTSGIISARARNINAGPYDDFLQTDASINRGNSGGPMFNMKGEVIGINTAIFSPSGGSVGIGFAIPSNMAKGVVSQIVEFGRTKRGWLGVRIQEVNQDIADGLNLPKASGALVASVTPGGPADKAGILAGDVIVKFDNKEVNQMRNLPRAVAETQVGKKSTVEILRKGSTITKEVAVGELEAAEKAENKVADKTENAAPVGKVKTLGMSLAQINPETSKQFDLRAGMKGVVISNIGSSSQAAEKGLAAGDVIVEINQQAVSTPDDVTGKINEARKSGRKSVLLLVESKGDLRFVALPLDGKMDDKTDSKPDNKSDVKPNTAPGKPVPKPDAPKPDDKKSDKK